MLGTAALSADSCKKPESFISSQHCLCLSGHCRENGLVHKIGDPNNKGRFKCQSAMLADPESIILFGDKMKIDGGGNPFSCLFLEPCLGPVPLTERQIKTSCLPTLTLSHHRIFRGSLPLNAWFQQSHRAKGQGKLNLWPSSLTKQL